jgi:glycosyltransferase involved in cell wall biosynthesis
VTPHVGLNLVYLVPGETGGMETYARELIQALRSEEPTMRLTAFVSREAYAADGPWHEIPCVQVPVRSRRRHEWVWGEQKLLPPLAATAGVDLVHSLASTGPLRGRFRRVVTIHDLIYRVHPEAHFGIRSAGMRVLVPLVARRSHRIIVPSESTRRDLERFLHTSPQKVDVIPEGVGAPSVKPTSESALRLEHDLGARSVLLTAAAKRPHKNLIRLLDALASIPPEIRPILVLPGYATPHEAKLRAHAASIGVSADTRFLGWISNPDLEGFYGIAVGFIFPSLYEGFGLPVLEAMVRGVPVASSDRASLPEVTGDAALLFDPEQRDAIAKAIETLVTDSGERERLRLAGLEQAARFTWAATARETRRSYDRARAGGSAVASSCRTAV